MFDVLYTWSTAMWEETFEEGSRIFINQDHENEVCMFMNPINWDGWLNEVEGLPSNVWKHVRIEYYEEFSTVSVDNVMLYSCIYEKIKEDRAVALYSPLASIKYGFELRNIRVEKLDKDDMEDAEAQA